MDTIPRDLLERLCKRFYRWDPLISPSISERSLFKAMTEPFGAQELLILRQDPENQNTFVSAWSAYGNPARTVNWASGTGPGTATTRFVASDSFLVALRKAQLKQQHEAILLDSKHEVDFKWADIGVFDPVRSDVGIMMYPWSLGGRDALICAIGNRQSVRDYESLFQEPDRDIFASMCALSAPCFEAARILLEKDLVSWRKLLRGSHADQQALLTCFFKGVLSREMMGLSKSSLGSHSIDLIVDVLSYFVAHRTCEDDRRVPSKLMEPFEKLLQAFDEFTVELFRDQEDILICWWFLLGFFLHCFIQQIQTYKGILLALSEQELLELYSRLAKAVKFFLLWFSKEGNPRGIYFSNTSRHDCTDEATDYFVTIGYLVSEYASLVDGMDRRLNIESDLRKMANTQALFYATKERYRDHFLHVLDVCLLGLFLVKAVFPEHSIFLYAVPLMNWFLASLFHDVGYIMELQRMLMTETEFLNFPEIKEFREHICSEVRRAELRFNEQARDRFERASIPFPDSPCDKINHGVVSALHVLDLLQSNGDSRTRDADMFAHSYADTVYAIAAHDVPGATLDLTRYPLAVLLRLCDEIQDWDRPRIDVLSFREQILAAVKYGGAFTPDGASMMRHVRIKAKGNPFVGRLSLPPTPNCRIPKLCITLDYRTVEDTDFYIIYSWLSKCYKFQGIALKNALDIEMTFLSKPRATEGDMNRFKVARRKHRIWHFEEWMNLVTAVFPDENGDERLTVSIAKLNQTSPIRVDPNDYLKILIQEW